MVHGFFEILVIATDRIPIEARIFAFVAESHFERRAAEGNDSKLGEVYSKIHLILVDFGDGDIMPKKWRMGTLNKI